MLHDSTARFIMTSYASFLTFMYLHRYLEQNINCHVSCVMITFESIQYIKILEQENNFSFQVLHSSFKDSEPCLL